MRGAWRAGAVCAALLLYVLACGGEQRAAGTIVVGHVASMTGDTATFGRSADQGMRMAIEKINAAGGVLGKPIELVDRGRPLRHRRGAHRGAEAPAARPGRGVARRGRVVALARRGARGAARARADDLARLDQSESDRGRRLRVSRLLHRSVPGRGDGALRGRGAERQARRDPVRLQAGLLRGPGRSSSARPPRKLGAEIVADERYTSGDIEFRAQLTTIRAAKPDAIFVPGYYTELGLIAKQARELGIDVPLLGGDGWDSEKTIEIGGKAVEGYYFSTHYAADSDSPRVQAFVSEFQAKYGATPDAMAALGYDTALILVDALDARRQHRRRGAARRDRRDRGLRGRHRQDLDGRAAQRAQGRGRAQDRGRQVPLPPNGVGRVAAATRLGESAPAAPERDHVGLDLRAVALGYTMVYGVLKLINFAHGEVYMVGAMAGYYAAHALGVAGTPSLGALLLVLRRVDGWRAGCSAR